VLFVSMLFAAHYKFCLQFVCILRLLESWLTVYLLNGPRPTAIVMSRPRFFSKVKQEAQLLLW